MSRILLVVLLVLTTAPLLRAQASEQDDAQARAAFREMAARLYRPRDAGLRELRFSFEVEVVPPDRPSTRHGPFRIHWREGEGWQLLDAEGGVDPAPEKRLSLPFTDRVVNDLVGWETEEMITGRGLRRLAERQIEVLIPGEAAPDEVAPERILLELDDEGALGRQTIVGTGGILLARLDYRYLDREGRRLVAKVRREAGGSRVVKRQSYQEVGPFTLLAEVRSTSSDRRLEIVRFRDLEPLSPPR